MDAIVIAGGTPQPGEPLYPYTQGKPKALLDVAGKPMIQWELDALCNSRLVERVVIIGLDPAYDLDCPKAAAHIPSQGSMLENLRSGIKKVLEINPQAHHVLVVSSDIPAINTEMVDWVINTAMQTDDDVYYNVITREAMEKRYPNSKRSYIHVKGMDVCGGDMNVMRTMTGTENDALWERIIAARKSIFKQAALVGYDTLLLLALRLIDIKTAERLASKRLHLKGRVMVCPFAEVGMDVDKPHQLEMMRADMERLHAVHAPAD